MSSLGRILRARNALPALVTVVALSVLAWQFGRLAIPIRLAADSLEHRVPLVETISLVSAVLVCYLTRPRLWHWERLGGLRTRLVSATVTGFAIVLPLVPILATAATLPTGTHWEWLAANAVILGGAVALAAALLGPLLGGGVVILVYFADAVIDNVLPELGPYLPLTAYSSRVQPTPGMDIPGPPAHWILAAALAVLAIAVNATTHGATGWSVRRGNNEGD